MEFISQSKVSNYNICSGNQIDYPLKAEFVHSKTFLIKTPHGPKKSIKKPRQKLSKFKFVGSGLRRPRTPHNTTQYIIQAMKCNSVDSITNFCTSMIGRVNIPDIENEERKIRILASGNNSGES